MFAIGKMQAPETQLSQKYELFKLSVHSSTQISTRTTAVSTRLGTSPAQGTKAVIVVLTAKARVANKLISIVEISKRELAAKGVAVFQYNALGSEMIEIPREQGMKEKGDVAENANSDGEDDAFEPTGPESDKKMRLVPTMTTYLSTVQIKELKMAYGEQRSL